MVLLLTGNLLVMSLVALAGYQAYQYLYYSQRFELQQVVFTGNRFANIDSLKGALDLGFPKNLMRVDLAKLRRVMESDPWVLQAQVRRVLPGTLKIDLLERQPAALAGVKDSIHVVDRDGVLLDRYSPRYGKFDLPLVKGLDAEPGRSVNEANRKRMSLFLRAMEELDSQGDQYTKFISEADVSDDQNLVIIPMDDTVRIQMGHQDFLKRFRIHQEKLSIYREMKEKYGGIDSIDLRYDKQIVYQPMNSSTPPAETQASMRNR